MLLSAIQQHKSAVIIHISPLLSLPSLPYPTPLGHHRVPGWAPCVKQQLPTHIHFTHDIYVDAAFSIDPSHSCPQVRSLHLHLHSFPANRFINTIFLDFVYRESMLVFLFLTCFTLYHKALASSTSLELTQIHCFSWLSNIPPHICTTSSLSIHSTYPKKTIILKYTCTPMLIAALFTITRTWKQPRYPSTDDVHIFKLACSIRNISIVHGESEVFPKTLLLNYGSQFSGENPNLGGMLTTTLFLRILPPMGRQRTLWALHPPKCFTLPTSVFLFGHLATLKKNQFNLTLAYSLTNFTILSLKIFSLLV